MLDEIEYCLDDCVCACKYMCVYNKSKYNSLHSTLCIIAKGRKFLYLVTSQMNPLPPLLSTPFTPPPLSLFLWRVVDREGFWRGRGSLTPGRSWETADLCVGQDVCKRQDWILYFRAQQLAESQGCFIFKHHFKCLHDTRGWPIMIFQRRYRYRLLEDQKKLLALNRPIFYLFYL